MASPPSRRVSEPPDGVDEERVGDQRAGDRQREHDPQQRTGELKVGLSARRQQGGERERGDHGGPRGPPRDGASIPHGREGGGRATYAPRTNRSERPCSHLRSPSSRNSYGGGLNRTLRPASV